MATLLLEPLVHLALGAAAALPAAQGPSGEAPALSAWIGVPDLYVEVADLGALDRDLQASSLGRLWAAVAPAVRAAAEGAPQAAQHRERIRRVLGLDGGSPSLVAARREVVEALAQELQLLPEHGAKLAETLGGRLCFAVIAPPGEEEAAATPALAVSTSLARGGSRFVADWIVPQLEERLAHAGDGGAAAAGQGPRIARLRQDEAGGGEVLALWSVGLPGAGEQYFLVRPGLAAWASTRRLADQLLGPPGGAFASDFAVQRQAALQRGERLWAYVSGRALSMEPEAREGLRALGLEGLRYITLGLRLEQGQLATRVRLEGVGDTGLAGLARPASSAWHGLDLLTSDAIAIAGMPRSLPDLVRELPAVAAAVDPGAGQQMRQLLAAIRGDPRLGPLLAAEALREETLLFVRPGAAFTPMPYVVLPVAEGADLHLERLQAEAAAAQAPEPPAPPRPLDAPAAPERERRFVVRVKELSGGRCYLVSASEQRNAATLAFLRTESGLLASSSAFPLQDWLRQRGRERVADREALVESLRASLRAGTGTASGSTGAPGPSLAAFVHVRTKPLVEWLWPFVMLGLQISGATAMEELPDAVDVAEAIGDTTWRVLRDGDAVEMRGRGLLGGLFVLF